MEGWDREGLTNLNIERGGLLGWGSEGGGIGWVTVCPVLYVNQAGGQSATAGGDFA